MIPAAGVDLVAGRVEDRDRLPESSAPVRSEPEGVGPCLALGLLLARGGLLSGGGVLLLSECAL
jgi:hypothetical protein